MTTIVPTLEEDLTLSVVRFTAELSWADAGPEVVFFFFLSLKFHNFIFHFVNEIHRIVVW